MGRKSKQRKGESFKTTRITKLANLRLKALEADGGIIEIVDSVDHGRVCSIKISDFPSRRDARTYADLLSLAPELLHFKNTTLKNLQGSLHKIDEKTRAIHSRLKSISKRLPRDKTPKNNK